MLKKVLSTEDKINILHSKIINDQAMEYLFKRFEELYIIASKNKGTLFELMYTDKLVDWDTDATETAITFLNDDDYIVRGNIENKDLIHSWILFKHHNKEYVLDPSLNILCKKRDYNNMFNPKILSLIPGKKIKEELISLLKKSNELTFVHSYGDISTPLYNNNSGYQAEIENSKIKKLTAYYYHKEL